MNGMKLKGIMLSMALAMSGVAVAQEAQLLGKVLDKKGKLHGTGLLHEGPATKGYGKTSVVLEDCEGLPADFDLRDFGVVPPTRDQGACGSCWAFSKTGSFESALLGQGKALNLSEQELVSCDRNNYGCGGGLLNQNEYQVAHGQGLETAFPYAARNAACRSIPVAAKATSFVYVGGNSTPSQKQVQCALFKSHVIPWTTVSAGVGNWGNPPQSDYGVFTSCRAGQTNHAIGVVGWRTIGGKFYWIARNSWGQWGSSGGRPGYEKGFALMPNGCNSLNDEVAYIVTDTMPCRPPQPKLPVKVDARSGDEILLGVKQEEGVTYAWYKGEVPVTTSGNTLSVLVNADADYRVVATNTCGKGESTTQVHALAGFEMIDADVD